MLKKDELGENVLRYLDIYLRIGKDLGLIISVAIIKDEKRLAGLHRKQKFQILRNEVKRLHHLKSAEIIQVIASYNGLVLSETVRLLKNHTQIN